MNNKKIALVACILVIFLMLTQTAQAGDWPMRGHDLTHSDWPMRGHDLTHSGVSDEVVSPPLILLWRYQCLPLQLSQETSSTWVQMMIISMR
jgi:hypothetical protein